MPNFVSPDPVGIAQTMLARGRFNAAVLDEAVPEVIAQRPANINYAASSSPQAFPVRPIISYNVDTVGTQGPLGSLPGRPPSTFFDGEQGAVPSVLGNQ